MRLLLISNSTNAGEAYLEYPKENINQFLGDIKDGIIFVPYAAVSFSYDEYLTKVQNRFNDFGAKIESVHNFENPADAIHNAKAIVVGGGNTFHLVKCMQETGVMDAIRERVLAGVPYIGWSAGSNVSCPTLCTTNDMPIVEPQSFNTWGLIPFQINPHYLDAHPDGHAGETREQRIIEYIAANRQMYVAGLREGCMFLVEDDKLTLIGKRPLRVFHYGEETREYNANDDLSFLMKR